MQKNAFGRPPGAIAGLAGAACALIAAGRLPGQHGQQSQDPNQPMYVAPSSGEAREAMKTFRLAPGLEVELVAAEPLLANPVAFAIDGRGRIYVAETFRIKDGVFDTRDYMQWKDEDLACLTVADRLVKYGRHIAEALPRYAAYGERVRLVLDENEDGVYDRSTVFAAGFADPADGIAAGVLPADDCVWFTNIPRLWRLRDADGDLAAEERVAVFDGFGVHTSLIGHDLHGLVIGPDRRLWFSIGDRGFHVVTPEGTTLAYPHEGAVLRCELDGSRLEVVHRGLRNPQELAFDDHGNLFTGDNNSDGGDRARLVQVVEGGDSGWRIGYQWLADRGAWHHDRMWRPFHPGQPAWIVPPVVNVADGPAGLTFDPGIGLPERFRGCLFLCDFRGGAGNSGVHALELERRGAGFELVRRMRPIWGVLGTDVDFGPDGAMYVLDWVHGWNKTGKGRIYRVTRPGQRNDLQLRAGAALLADDFGGLAEARLLSLLAHDDRRVRQKAQFELVDRDARGSLLAAARDPDRRRARLHAIWGIGVIGRRDPQALEPLLPLLEDGDAEVRCQIARVVGDARLQTARERLVDLLEDETARAAFEAALALGRLGPAADPEGAGDDSAAVTALFAMLARNADRDAMLRHAAVVGLAGTAPLERLHAARGDPSSSVRLGALLALRRRADPGVADFLRDADGGVRAEAARAIHDVDILEALPVLAEQLQRPAADDPVVARRALNACRRLGQPEHAKAIADFARDDSRPIDARIEALRILAEWRAPHGQDRVHGNWRPCEHPDADRGVELASTALIELLAADGAVAAAAAAACSDLRLAGAGPALLRLAASQQRPTQARVAALRALDVLDVPAIGEIVDAIGPEDPVSLRKAAVEIFGRRDPARAAPVLATLCERASLPERQAAFAALGALAHASAAPILVRWLDELVQGKVDLAVQLDLLEAAARRSEPAVQQRLAAILPNQPGTDPLLQYRVCLEGGDRDAGRRLFREHEQTRCTRCHAVRGEGGTAGPALDGIGSRQSREYLLESLVLPGRTIAKGYATTVLQLHNGDLLAGMLLADQDGAVEIMTPQGDVRQVAWERIARRSTADESAMPAMAGVLDRRQLRDLVAYLASLVEQR